MPYRPLRRLPFAARHLAAIALFAAALAGCTAEQAEKAQREIEAAEQDVRRSLATLPEDVKTSLRETDEALAQFEDDLARLSEDDMQRAYRQVKALRQSLERDMQALDEASGDEARALRYRVRAQQLELGRRTETLRLHAAATREAFIAVADTSLEGLRRTIERVETRVSEADAAGAYHETLEDMRQEHQALLEDLVRIQEAREDEFDALRPGMTQRIANANQKLNQITLALTPGAPSDGSDGNARPDTTQGA
jgi:Skp family chaperone for outer membrane proteins